MKDDTEGKKQLATLLFQCFTIQKAYGKDPEALEQMVPAFQAVLADFPMAAIARAFTIHLQTSEEIPTPKSIYQIMRPPEPEPDWAAYVGIKEKIKNDIFVTDEQRNYLRWCENKAVMKLEKWRTHAAEFEPYMIPYSN